MVDTSYIGLTYPEVTFEFEAGKLHEFLLAIDDPNPAYFEEGVPVPPTFTTLMSFWAGGGLEVALKRIDVNIWNVLHGEQEYTYLSPIYVGDRLTSITRIDDIYSRGSGENQMTFVVMKTDFTNQDGKAVLEERSLIIVREGE